MVFVSASSLDKPLLVVATEVSETAFVYKINSNGVMVLFYGNILQVSIEEYNL